MPPQQQEEVVATEGDQARQAREPESRDDSEWENSVHCPGREDDAADEIDDVPTRTHHTRLASRGNTRKRRVVAQQRAEGSVPVRADKRDWEWEHSMEIRLR